MSSTTRSTSSDSSAEVVTLTQEAYQTAVFHALKHEHCVVSGLLLGTASAAGWTVTRAVPLFHSAVPLAAMSEAALALVAAAITVFVGVRRKISAKKQVAN